MLHNLRADGESASGGTRKHTLARARHMDTMAIPRLEDLENKQFDAFAMEKAMRGSYPDPYPKVEELRKPAMSF